MGALFSKPKAQPKPEVDPELLKQQQEKEAELARMKQDEERRNQEERSSRLRGLRGFSSLLSAGSKPGQKKSSLG